MEDAHTIIPDLAAVCSDFLRATEEHIPLLPIFTPPSPGLRPRVPPLKVRQCGYIGLFDGHGGGFASKSALALLCHLEQYRVVQFRFLGDHFHHLLYQVLVRHLMASPLGDSAKPPTTSQVATAAAASSSPPAPEQALSVPSNAPWKQLLTTTCSVCV